MDFHSLFAILSGGIVGLLLGATGGGGSLIAIPLLVYVVGVPVQKATALSLVVVGYSALFGAWQAYRNGMVRGFAAILFSGTGIIGSWLGAQGHTLVPPNVILLFFGILLCSISAWTLLKGHTATVHQAEESCAKRFSLSCVSKALGIGFIVGLLSGFFGVGGGFLMVPALLFVMGFPMNHAIGTSLLIIGVISIGGIWGHLHTAEVDDGLAALIIGGSLVGTWAGARMGKATDEQSIQKVFAFLAGATGLFLLMDNGLQLLG